MKNKAEIKTETIPTHKQQNTLDAAHLVDQAGEALKPSGFQHLGYVTIHFYRSSFSINPTFEVRMQKSLGGVEEGLADFGLKELKKAMMAAYGRRPPATRS